MKSQCFSQDVEKAEEFSDILLMILELVKSVMCVCEDEINNRLIPLLFRFNSSTFSFWCDIRLCNSNFTSSRAYIDYPNHSNGTSREAAALCSEEEDIDTSVLQCYHILKRKVIPVKFTRSVVPLNYLINYRFWKCSTQFAICLYRIQVLSQCELLFGFFGVLQKLTRNWCGEEPTN